MNIQLHSQQTAATMVSNQFLDYYMPQANGEFVKVYLYLLRCFSDRSKSLTISEISDKLNHTEKDTIRALRYWESVGLLALIYDSENRITDITLLELKSMGDDKATEAKVVPQKTEVKVEHSQPVLTANSDTNSLTTNIEETASVKAVIAAKQSIAPIAEKQEYSNAQLRHFLANDDVSQILYIAQRYLGKTFSATETNTILYFYDGLHFPSELIEYLIEYCVSSSHKSMRYIEKVAISWAEKGIRTVKQAKAHTASFNQNCFSVMKAFGLSNRSPGSSELAAIQKWQRSYGMSLDIILEACARTIKAIHQPSFEYADSILTKWHSLGVKTLADIEILDLEFQQKGQTANQKAIPSHKPAAKASANRFNNITPRSYVYDDLEKQLLNN